MAGNDSDTIFALATVRGRSAIAIVRISGTKTPHVIQSVAGNLPNPRRATLCKLKNKQGEQLDEALVLWFEKEGSYTGEASAELHLHGGISVIQSVLRMLEIDCGLRVARPGEFTLRALRNGRMDLCQVEGLGDLIAAETDRQRQMAMRAYNGAVGNIAQTLNNDLTKCLALIETEIEFSEEDIPATIRTQAVDIIYDVCGQLHREAHGIPVAERLRHGFEVAIIGEPNCGKSTLLNYIAGREAAITSDIAGTTRDIIEVQLELDGLPVCLIDTAGLRTTDDPIEIIGVDRAMMRAQAADLRIFLVENIPVSKIGITPYPDDLILQAKIDLIDPQLIEGVSGKTGQGVEAMIYQIASRLERRIASIGSVTNQRQHGAIIAAVESLERAQYNLESSEIGIEFAAEEIRIAINKLDSLTGTIGVEHVLEQIFANFCIGK